MNSWLLFSQACYLVPYGTVESGSGTVVHHGWDFKSILKMSQLTWDTVSALASTGSKQQRTVVEFRCSAAGFGFKPWGGRGEGGRETDRERKTGGGREKEREKERLCVCVCKRVSERVTE